MNRDFGHDVADGEGVVKVRDWCVYLGGLDAWEIVFGGQMSILCGGGELAEGKYVSACFQTVGLVTGIDLGGPPCTKVCKYLPPALPDDVDELAERRSLPHEDLEKCVEIAEVNSEYHYPGDSCFGEAHLT